MKAAFKNLIQGFYKKVKKKGCSRQTKKEITFGIDYFLLFKTQQALVSNSDKNILKTVFKIIFKDNSSSFSKENKY